MLDDFREQASSSEFFDEEEAPRLEETSHSGKYFLGMKPAQRFVIALMLLLITCLLSTFCLLVTEKIVLPFL